MKMLRIFSMNIKLIVCLFVLLLILVFTIQGFLLHTSNNIRKNIQLIHNQLLSFEKKISEVTEDIAKIEENPNLSYFEKKQLIKNILNPLLKDFEKIKKIEEFTYYSYALDIKFNLFTRDEKNYFFSSKDGDSVVVNSLTPGFDYNKNKSLELKHMLYNNGKPFAYIILKKNMKSALEIFLSLIPQIVVFLGVLMIIAFFIYNQIQNLIKKTANLYKKQLINFDKKSKYLRNNKFLEEKIPKEFQPFFYNLVVKLSEFEKVLREISHTASLKDLIPVMAHEVKNPVSVIKGNAQLGIKTNSKKKRDEIFNRIDKNCDLVNRFLNESIQLMKPSNSKREILKIETLIDDLLVVVEPMIKIQGINFIKSFEANNKYIKVNNISVSHALINIIKNAVDATCRGGKITLKTYTKNDKVYISIEDTGCGISEEMKDKIFDKYFTTKKNSGTGIGLALAYSIIKKHNGKLWFESKIDKGTIFYIQLPLFKKEK